MPSRFTAEEEAAIRKWEKWLKFHDANPRVYADLVDLSRETKALGHKKFGFPMIWNVYRWQIDYSIEKTDGDTYVLNNNLSAGYNRAIMLKETDLRSTFSKRAVAGSWDSFDYKTHLPGLY